MAMAVSRKEEATMRYPRYAAARVTLLPQRVDDGSGRAGRILHYGTVVGTYYRFAYGFTIRWDDGSESLAGDTNAIVFQVKQRYA